MYDPMLVDPMREEVREVGFQELTTADDVDTALKGGGTALVFVNSVCGCAAGGARPALRMALQEEGSKRPENLYSVFAGMDRDATDRARSYFVGYQPSSPCMALLKDGEVVHMIERHHIEGNMPEAIARSLVWAFGEYC
ncbi:BrxA/BrxB family bacilliredoxin [bacterium]|nr:BrxA/BrxB family bacilliredoxin [bacterium]